MAHKLVVHSKRSAYDVYIGRPSRWGNPFTHIPSGTRAEVVVKDRAEAVRAYREWVERKRTVPGHIAPTIEEIVRELKGKTLGCWCAPQACHGDVLAEIANA